MTDLLVLAAISCSTIYLVTLVFLISGFLRIKNEPGNQRLKISVVVAARNEERHLESCLTALLNQTYPKNLTQFIVVNDRSTDKTAEIINRFQETASLHRGDASELEQIIITKIPSGISPKKHALDCGIKSTTGEVIFTTDADCTPPQEWLAKMSALFREDVGVVFGFVPFEMDDSLWQKLLALNNLASALVAAGGAGWNIGITCTGRNFAYRKSLFEEINGFQKINHSLSGDDDLLLQTIKKHTKCKVAFSLSPDTAVPSPAAKNLREFIAQRRRHVSAARYYSKPIQAGYLLFNLANLFLFTFLIFSLLFASNLALAITLFSMKLILDFYALYLVSARLGKQRLLFIFPVWELFFLIEQTFISPLGFVGKIKWKP